MFSQVIAVLYVSIRIPVYIDPLPSLLMTWDTLLPIALSSDDHISSIQHEKEDEKGQYEGWRSRGWLTVLGSFLIIFSLTGINTNWGVFEVL